MKNKIIKNWSILTISNLVGQLLGMMATIFVARALLPADYGFYSLVMVYADMGVLVAGLGIRQILIRELSRKPEFARQYLKKIAFFQFLVSVPVAVFILIRFHYTNEDLHVVSATSVTLMYCILLWQLFNAVAFSHEDIATPALINLAERMLWLLLLWLAPKHLFTINNIAILFVSVQLFKSLTLMVMMHKRGYLAVSIEKSSKNLIKIAAPLYWVELLVIVTDQLPIFFLSANSSAEQLGYFYASLKLILPVEMMIMTLLSVIMPSLSKAYGNPLIFNRLVKQSIIAIVSIGIVVSSVTTILNNEIIYIIFGQNYDPAATVLHYQIWYAIIIAVLDFMGTALIASNNQHKLGVLSTIAACVYAPIMWYSSYYGAIGLAIGFLAVGCINLMYWWPVFQKSLQTPISINLSLRLFLAVLVSFIIANGISEIDNIWSKITIVLLMLSTLSVYVYKLYLRKKQIANISTG